MATLEEVTILGLYGNIDYHIKIVDNTLVLVGENGTGKSTVSNLIYLFLAAQWRKMLTYNFKEIKLKVDGEEFVIDRSNLTRFQEESEYNRRIPTSVRRRIEVNLARFGLEYLNENKDRFIFDLANEVGMSTRMAMELINDYLINYIERTSSALESVTKGIKEKFSEQILLLPTYRRIEQDLKKIFPDMDSSVRDRRTLNTKREIEQGYIEFVEFGMEDVALLIDSKLGNIKETIRNGLNKLTSTYLIDILNIDYRSIDIRKFKNIDSKSIRDLFGRLEKSILPEYQQDRLLKFLDQIKSKDVFDENDKIIAHFLSKLIELNKKQETIEQDVSKFTEICNTYFFEKKMIYDRSKFSIYLKRVDKEGEAIGKDIPLKDLSSGEKQIVSLFAHLLLSDKEKFFMIIDEPELSLSVLWQRKFLTDILETKKCSGLIAVTHSPFIFDNYLDGFAHDIEEFRGEACVSDR